MAVVVSIFPLTLEVVRLRPGEATEDAHGNEQHGPPVEDTLLVFAWWIGSSGEPNLTGHVERVESDATMIAAPGDFQPSDQVVLQGAGLFEVDGHPANFDNNPWWSPGVETVALRMVGG